MLYIKYKNTDKIIKKIKKYMNNHNIYKIAFLQKNINLVDPTQEFIFFLCEEDINFDKILNEFKNEYSFEFGKIFQKKYDFNFAKNQLSYIEWNKDNLIRFMPLVELPCLIIKKNDR